MTTLSDHRRGLAGVAGMLVLIGGWLVWKVGALNSARVGEIFGAQVEYQTFPSGMPLAAWLWVGPESMTDDEMELWLSKAQGWGITELYVNVGILAEADQLNQFESKLKRFVEKAGVRGIEIQGLAGDPGWADSTDFFRPLRVVHQAAEYNQENPDSKLAGIQFDVEFYNHPAYVQDREKWILGYLDLVKTVSDAAADSAVIGGAEFKIGWAVPFWIDQSSVNLPEVTWRGTRATTLQHLVAASERKAGTYLASMAYRNRAHGWGGTIEVIRREMDYLEEIRPEMKIIIGQDTARGEGGKTTFWGKTDQELKREMTSVASSYQTYNVFGGMAIHSLESYAQLKR